MHGTKVFGSTLLRFSRSALRCSSKLVSCPEMASVPEFSFEHYDAIGFDLDHTICKYNLPSLFNLIYDSLARYMVEKCSYPSVLLDRHAHEHHWVQKGIVLDKAKGNFLKLDKNWTIAKAYHGTCVMSKEDIAAAYGNGCIWDESTKIPHKVCSNTYLEEPFYIFKDYFTTIGAVLCAKVVDCLDKENKGPLPSYSFFEHYLSALYHIYGRDNFKRNTGFYFPSLKENPQMYIEKCSPKLKQWLRSIREHKKLFLLTSSHSDIARFLAEICIGRDWRDYFDVVITYAKKPSFFTDTCPFYALEDDRETNFVTVQQMRPSEIYSQGNWSDLNVLFGVLCNTNAPKVLYIGDSMLEDVYAPSHCVGWDTIAIVEELFPEGDISHRGEGQHILQSDTWGSFFSVQHDGNVNRTLWCSLLSENCKIAVPSLDMLSNIEVNEKVPSFSATSPFAGYYPSLPSACRKLL